MKVIKLILDAGICTIYATANGAAAGGKPIEQLTQKFQSWYAELDFSSDPNYATDYREDVEASARIRIHQNRSITTRDAAKIGGQTFEIIRAYHGTDDDNGQPITDLTLRRVS